MESPVRQLSIQPSFVYSRDDAEEREGKVTYALAHAYVLAVCDCLRDDTLAAEAAKMPLISRGR